MVLDDGTKVKVVYQTLAPPVGPAVVDPVYKIDQRPQQAQPVELPDVPCVIKVIAPHDQKILAFGILEAGDAILYFLDSFKLNEPVCGKAAVPQTIHFIDSLGTHWTPILKDAGPLLRHLQMIIANKAIAEVVPCSIKR